MKGSSSHDVRVSVSLFLVRARQMEGCQKMVEQILSLAREEESLANEIAKACRTLYETTLDITNDCVDCRIVKNLAGVQRAVQDIDGFLQGIAESPWASGVLEPLVNVRKQVSTVSRTVQVTFRLLSTRISIETTL